MLSRWDFQKIPLRKQREGFEESFGLSFYSFVSPAIMPPSFVKKVLVRERLRQKQQPLWICARMAALPGSVSPMTAMSAVAVAMKSCHPFPSVRVRAGHPISTFVSLLLDGRAASCKL